jgi:LPS export ABC transporter protein LptC
MFMKKELGIAGAGPGRWVPGLLVLLLLPIALAGCDEGMPTPVASPPLMETGADAVWTGLQHFISLNGIREGELFADTAFSYRDSSVYYLVNPELILFTDTGARRARVTSERGRFNPHSREMLANGNVILVITEGNKRVESEELNYDPNGDRIWSDSATTMVEPGRVSEGLGFESDLNFRRTVVGPGSIRNTGGGTAADTAGPTGADTVGVTAEDTIGVAAADTAGANGGGGGG